MSDERIKQILEIILEDKASAGLKTLNTNLDTTGKSVDKSKSTLSGLSSLMPSIGGSFGSMGSAVAGVASGLAVFGLAAAGASAAFNIISSAIAAPIAEASEAQDVFNKMTGALVASGQYSKEAVKNFEEFASAMQASTKYSDDQVKGLLSLSVNLGATADQSDDLVRAAMGMSAALGIDVESATQMLAKTLSGEASPALKKMGIDLSGVSEESLKSGEAIRIVGERFKGLAEGELNTFSGALVQQKNAWADVLEAIGETIVQNPAVIALIKAMTEGFKLLTQYISENSEEIKDFIADSLEVMLDVFGKIVIAIGYFGKALIFLGDTVAEAGILLGEMTTTAAKFLGLPFADGMDNWVKAVKKFKDETANSLWDASENVIDFGQTIDDLGEKIQKGVSVKTSLDVNASNIQLSANSLSVQKIKLESLDVTAASGDGFNGSSLADIRMFDEQNMAEVESKIWFDDFKMTMYDAFTSLGGRVFSNMLEGMSSGRAGAADFVASTMGLLADSVVPGSGAFVEQIVKLASQEKAVMVENIRGFFDEINNVITNIAANMPTLIAEFNMAMLKSFTNLGPLTREIMQGFAQSLGPALADTMNAYIYAPQEFIRGIVDNVDEIVVAFVDGMIDAADDIADAIIEAIVGTGDYLGEKTSSLFGGGDSGGGDFISEIGSAIGNVASTVGGWFGFASGGKVMRVNSPISGKDTVPARLAQGEVVVDASTTSKLDSFLDGNNGSGMSEAILLQILDAVSRPQTIETSVNIGAESFAKAIYQVNKSNYRTA